MPDPSAEDFELADALRFDHFVMHTLRLLTSAPLRRMMMELPVFDYDSGAVPYRPDALVFKAGQQSAGQLIAQLKQALNGKGYIVFRSEQNFGHAPDEIAVLRSTDPFDILRCKSTEAPNYEIDNASLIATLKSWHAETPFEIIGAGHDWVEVRFHQLPADLEAMAEKVFAFCPDTIEQGSGSPEALAVEMRETGTLYLWWD